MPSIWEKFKAARAQQKTPEGQAKLRKQTESTMSDTEGLMGGGMAGTTKKMAGPVRKIVGLGLRQTKKFKGGVAPYLKSEVREFARTKLKALRGGKDSVESAGKAIGDAGKATKKAILVTGRAAKDKLLGTSRKLGSLKEKAVALGTAGVVGASLRNSGNANQTPKPEAKSTTPATVSMTERMKTQSNAEANKPTETPKPVSRSESKYSTYKKDSQEAKDFRKNFGEARKSGAKEFEFQGRKYNTKVKGE